MDTRCRCSDYQQVRLADRHHLSTSQIAMVAAKFVEALGGDYAHLHDVDLDHRHRDHQHHYLTGRDTAA